jgi:hypothetical protein
VLEQAPIFPLTGAYSVRRLCPTCQAKPAEPELEWPPEPNVELGLDVDALVRAFTEEWEALHPRKPRRGAKPKYTTKTAPDYIAVIEAQRDALGRDATQADTAQALGIEYETFRTHLKRLKQLAGYVW